MGVNQHQQQCIPPAHAQVSIWASEKGCWALAESSGNVLPDAAVTKETRTENTSQALSEGCRAAGRICQALGLRGGTVERLPGVAGNQALGGRCAERTL